MPSPWVHAQDIFDIVPDDYIWFGVSIKNVKLVSSDGVDGKANSRSCRLTPTLLESGKVLKSLSFHCRRDIHAMKILATKMQYFKF